MLALEAARVVRLVYVHVGRFEYAMWKLAAKAAGGWSPDLDVRRSREEAFGCLS